MPFIPCSFVMAVEQESRSITWHPFTTGFSACTHHNCGGNVTPRSIPLRSRAPRSRHMGKVLRVGRGQGQELRLHRYSVVSCDPHRAHITSLTTIPQTQLHMWTCYQHPADSFHESIGVKYSRIINITLYCFGLHDSIIAFHVGESMCLLFSCHYETL